MGTAAFFITGACIWFGGLLVALLAWRRSVWIDDFYEKHGRDSTHWWAWPYNSGKPL